MKKITMVVLNKEREDFLLKLRREGVIHIKSLARPTGQDIVSMEEKVSQVQKAIAILPPSAEEKGLEESELVNKAREIVSKQEEMEELEKNIQDTKNALIWYRPWGGFNPADLSLLKERGINLRLYVLNKPELKNVEGVHPALSTAKSEPEARKGWVHVINKEGGHFYVVSLEALPYPEVKPPAEDFSILQARLEECNKKLLEIKKSTEEKAVFRQPLCELLKKLQKTHKFLEVFYGMKHEDGFSLLQGFCPIPEVSKVVRLANEYNVGYLMEDPDDPSETPTLIRNPSWLRIVEPVFKFINTLPGYNEFDISPVFLVFFSLFFAMIVGDAGYGLLFLGATYLIRRKARNVPAEPFRLMYLLSTATLVWGAVTGTWFGFEKIARLPVLNSLVIDSINSFASGNQGFVIYICFIIGVIHLSVAHLMRFIRMINSFQSIAQLGWVFLLWGLFFLAGTLVISRPFPNYAKYFFIFGIGMVLLFSNFQKNILKGILISLRDVPLGVAGSFGDIVSYLRLFAVGSASVAVASSFNSIAMGIGFSNVLRGLFAGLILFAAHALNITLSFLAVIVHGIRLNMLEFSGHLGQEWSGNNYAPFAE